MRTLRIALAFVALILLSRPAFAGDERWTYAPQFSMSPKGVNIQTGRFQYQKVDLAVGPLAMKRSWTDTSIYVGPPITMGGMGAFGQSPQGWTNNYIAGMTHTSTNNVDYWNVFVDGTQYMFKVMVDGTPAPGNSSTQGTNLFQTAGQWIFTDSTGAQYKFVSVGSYLVLQMTTYADNHTLYYSYNSNAQPTLVVSNRGYAIAMEYNGLHDLIAACGFNTTITTVSAGMSCSGATLKTAYTYDSTGSRLTSITDVSGGVTNISYFNSGTNNWYLPSCITLVNSATCAIQNVFGPQPGDSIPTWTKRDQVRVQTTATGNVWQYSYEPAPDPNDQPRVQCRPVWSTASMTDPTGFITMLTYDHGLLVENLANDGSHEYRYPVGCTTGTTGTATLEIEIRLPRPPLVITPSGPEYFEFDLRGNVVKHAVFPSYVIPPLENGNAWLPAPNTDYDLSRCCLALGKPQIPVGSLVYQQTFKADWYGVGQYGQAYVFGCGAGAVDGKVCNKPLTQVDARGNQTDFAYDPDHGGVLTETGPAVNGVRPQTRYTYVQRQAWIKSGGSYAQSGQSVWLLAAKSTCRTGAASGAGCALANDEVKTAYDYGPDSGPNNLVLRGVVDDATGLALRTCYGYDWMGNKISETKPRAGLTSCP